MLNNWNEWINKIKWINAIRESRISLKIERWACNWTWPQYAFVFCNFFRNYIKVFKGWLVLVLNKLPFTLIIYNLFWISGIFAMHFFPPLAFHKMKTCIALPFLSLSLTEWNWDISGRLFHCHANNNTSWKQWSENGLAAEFTASNFNLLFFFSCSAKTAWLRGRRLLFQVDIADFGPRPNFPSAHQRVICKNVLHGMRSVHAAILLAQNDG